jgi:glucosyl-3-phosphoglycerate synthase
MSDFAQAGGICTLQRLNETHLAAIEERVMAASRARPVALIVPCRGNDLAEPAFAHLLAEVRGASWLSEVVVSVNGASDGMISAIRPLLEGLPARVLWNDGPELAPVYAELLDTAPSELPHGKGLNVWAALGLLAVEQRVQVVATQDCDVASFRRQSLARLCLPCVDPLLGFRFAKMYYSRVSDRLYGRVTRLFFQPLLRAVLRVAGHRPLLDFLLAFRYALAGEIAIERRLAETVEFHPGWGLETAMLGEVFRHAEPSAVCQVDGGPGYDHRHQGLVAGAGLERMCGEIAGALLAQLAQEGVVFSASSRAALADAFRKEGELALRRSEALAVMNALAFDTPGEGALVEAFAATLAAAHATKPLPPWERLLRDKPAMVERMRRAAEDSPTK